MAMVLLINIIKKNYINIKTHSISLEMYMQVLYVSLLNTVSFKEIEQIFFCKAIL